MYALVRRCRVAYYLGDLVQAYVDADRSKVQETLPTRENEELTAPPAPTAEAGGKDREERQHIMVAIVGPLGCAVVNQDMFLANSRGNCASYKEVKCNFNKMSE